MSEAELHILKARMLEGRRAKARRGELGKSVPMGYLRRPSGEVVLDPDEQAQGTIRLVFGLFQRFRTVGKVLRYLVEHNILMPVRTRGGPGKGELEWHRANRPSLHNLIGNPFYAGVYVYGLRSTDRRRQKPGRPGTGRRPPRPEDAEVFLPDRVPAYISWEQFQRNQSQDWVLIDISGRWALLFERQAVQGFEQSFAGHPRRIETAFLCESAVPGRVTNRSADKPHRPALERANRRGGERKQGYVTVTLILLDTFEDILDGGPGPLEHLREAASVEHQRAGHIHPRIVHLACRQNRGDRLGQCLGVSGDAITTVVYESVKGFGHRAAPDDASGEETDATRAAADSAD
jgi:hypothetical protein